MRKFRYIKEVEPLKDKVLTKAEADSVYLLAVGEVLGVHFKIYQNGRYMRIDYMDADGIELEMTSSKTSSLVKWDSAKTLKENVSTAYNKAVDETYELDEEENEEENSDELPGFRDWADYDRWRYGNYWQKRNREVFSNHF